MSSPWTPEVMAVLRKEAATEWRTKTGLATGGLYGLATVVTVAFALFNRNPNTGPLRAVCASLVWSIVLFASLLSLPRAFLGEEENGTGDLLRLMARPHAVFWGKAIFNVAQSWIGGLATSGLFLAFTGLRVAQPLTFLVCLLGGGAAVASAVTLCGAIAAQAQHRAALAGAIAIPLLLPLLQWGVAGMKAAFGDGLPGVGTVSMVGMGAYAVVSLALGPWIYAAVWKS